MNLLRSRRLLAVPFLVAAALCAAVTSTGRAGNAAGVQVVAADGAAVVVQLTLPKVRVGRQTVGAETFDTVSIDGWGATDRPGWPELPVRGVLLAAPSAGRPELRLVEATSEVWRDIRPLPAPVAAADGLDGAATIRPEYRADPTAYAALALYPAQAVTLSSTGRIREQHVVQVLFQPFQYDAARRELRVYRSLRVEVRFAPGAASAHPADGTVFDSLLAMSLPNYAAVRKMEAGEGTAPTPALPRFAGEGAAPTPTLPPPGGGGRLPSPFQGEGLGVRACAVKVIVEANGFYRVSGSALASAGLDLAQVDPRRLQLSRAGTAVPLQHIGTTDGRLDPDDAIEFYGVRATGPYTDRNAYWLTMADQVVERMPSRSGYPRPDVPVASTFTDTLHLEENHLYGQDVRSGEGVPGAAGEDYWFWDRIMAREVHTYTFSVPGPAQTGGEAAVRVALRGRTDVPDVAPDHHTRVYLNGRLMDDSLWDGKIQYSVAVTVPQSDLADGPNSLVVQSVGDTGASVDSIFLDWFEVDYARRYVARDDRLVFAAPAPGTWTYEVEGFSVPEVELYEIGDPDRPIWVTHVTYQTDAGTFGIRFSDDAAASTRYLALPARDKLTPAAVVADSPSSLRSPDNRADYILIAHADFMAAAQRLAEHRRRLGLAVAVVDVADVYDEFSAGVFDPRAIRDFLAYAYAHWKRPAPVYVLLLGDASYDFKDFLGTHRPNYVPSYLVDTPSFGQAPSDNWYAEVSGDDLYPDLLIGRLSVATSEDADTVVDKIIRYDGLPGLDGWTASAVFVADDELSFEIASNRLAARLPAGVTPSRIYTRQYSQPQSPTSDFISAVDRGALAVSYVGHGNVNLWGSWAGGRIFETAMIDRLDNAYRQPLLTVIGCLNGFFAHPETGYSLAEEWVRAPDKGGVAAWAPGGLGYLWPESALLDAFYAALFSSTPGLPLGAAAAQAVTAGLSSGSAPADLTQTYILLGDPALRPAVPGRRHELLLPVLRRRVGSR